MNTWKNHSLTYLTNIGSRLKKFLLRLSTLNNGSIKIIIYFFQSLVCHNGRYRKLWVSEHLEKTLSQLSYLDSKLFLLILSTSDNGSIKIIVIIATVLNYLIFKILFSLLFLDQPFPHHIVAIFSVEYTPNIKII